MKVFFDSIGCRLNQSEIEKMAARFIGAGHELVDNAGAADLVVINTCAVTAAASADSRSKIRKAAGNGSAKVVLTGCYATIDTQEALTLPGVSRIYLNSEKNQLVDDWASLDGHSPFSSSARQPLPGVHHRTRAFIKVQDGCENHCTFCLTRLARGDSRSQSEAEILADVRWALAGGAKEIVLTGVNLGSWGKDLPGGGTLAGLIKRVITDFNPTRLRLSSLEPWDVTDALLEKLTLPGFCHHFHLPLQSGSESVLKRMGRKFTKDDFRFLMQKLRAIDPLFSVTTDIMVGFPGETVAQFEESLSFIKEMQFSGAHVFAYSLRPGTAAAQMTGQIPGVEMKRRSAEMRRVVHDSAMAYRAKWLGREMRVLWEECSQESGVWKTRGLADEFVRVRTEACDNIFNTMANVKIQAIEGLELIGKITSADLHRV